MVEDRLQDLDSATCGIISIYFYENLFNLEENSRIQGNAKLNNFSLDDKENEIKMEEYVDKLNINIL